MKRGRKDNPLRPFFLRIVRKGKRNNNKDHKNKQDKARGQAKDNHDKADKAKDKKQEQRDKTKGKRRKAKGEKQGQTRHKP